MQRSESGNKRRGTVADTPKRCAPALNCSLHGPQKAHVSVYSCNSAPRPRSREAVTREQWVTAMIDTAGPTDTIAAPPRLSCLSCTLGCFHESSSPHSLLDHVFSSLVLGAERAGSLAQHENDIINRQKWTVLQWASERERDCEGGGWGGSTVKCSVIVM